MLSVNFHPFPILQTERLVLRRITPADAADLFVLRTDGNVMRFIPRPLAETIADVLQLIQTIDDGTHRNETINWAIALQADNKLIGTIGFVRMSLASHRAEVGYLLHPQYQGKGIMQEALARIIDPKNTASAKLLERNNFVKEAYFKENCFFEGKFLDSVHYSLLAPK